MTSEGLGEMFEGDYADTCAGKFPLVLMVAKRRVSCAQTRERGPPSAHAEYYLFIYLFSVNIKAPRHRFGLSLCLGLATRQKT